MLTGLSVSNFAVAKNITLDLDPGLTVLTGETGAGKSILVGALLVGLGGRWQQEYLRDGADRSVVELVFHLGDSQRDLLPDPSVLEDGEIVLSRTIDSEGKSRVRIGGSLANLTALKETSSRLVDVHSQFEAQSLLDPKVHLLMLDRYAGPDNLAILDEFRAQAKKFDALLEELVQIRTSENDRRQRIDYISYELDQFEQVSPQEGEDESLNAERTRLSNIQRLADLAQTIRLSLEGSDEQQGIRSLNRIAQRSFADLSRIDPKASEIGGMIDIIEANAQEALFFISSYINSLTFDPDRLQVVEDRLAVLGKLTRRFGSSLADAFEGVEKLKKELERLSKSEERLSTIENEIELERKNLSLLGEKLVRSREKAAQRLSEEMVAQLGDLALEKAKFSVQFQLLPPGEDKYIGIFGEKCGFGGTGPQYCEFVISTNPGEKEKSIQKVASGGELSRIMLALKVILSEVDRTPTLIFDEVDTGVGGRVGEMIGRKLAKLSQRRQVICITHLPQIACFGDTHLLIQKTQGEDETTIACLELARRGRVDELARMLSGDRVTPISLKHAEEMLLQAQKIKGQ